MARFLERHPKVERLLYPGLESHRQHDLARSQMSGFGGMVVARMDVDAAMKLVQKVRVFTYAMSLGDYQSLLFYYPTNMFVDSAPYLDAEQMKAIRVWVGDDIMRISFGLEDPEDLIADLDQALGDV